jgi:hypothetical protein
MPAKAGIHGSSDRMDELPLSRNDMLLFAAA